MNEKHDFKHTYDLDLPIEEKIEKVVTNIYGGNKVTFTSGALKQLKQIKENGWIIIRYVWLKHNIHLLMTKIV